MKEKNEEIVMDNFSIDESSFLKRQKNGLLLSDNDISILNKYNIAYEDCLNIKELLFNILSILNDNPDFKDLEELSIKLSEIDYYNYVNK